MADLMSPDDDIIATSSFETDLCSAAHMRDNVLDISVGDIGLKLKNKPKVTKNRGKSLKKKK